MKVIYNTCYADPWVKVAQKLKNEHDWEPVYWNGYDDDNSKNLVPEYFPNAIYHPYYDAWKGVFPPEINNKYPESYIDIDFLKEYASFELQAIKMMDRMDPDGHSFSFMERQRHFRRMVKYWSACIDYLNPDLVISAIVPHRVFDYVLYLLCKHKRIKYITFRNSAFHGYIVPLTNVMSIESEISETYHKLLNSSKDKTDFLQELNSDIADNYYKIQQDYSIAEPDYMKQHIISHKQSDGLISLIIKFLKDSRLYKNKYFGKNGFLLNGIPTYYKEKHKNIETSRVSLLKYSILKLSTNWYKKRLKSYYNAQATKNPDLDLPYVLLPLHYQPEMTTCPSGDIFADQLLCVESLLKNLPSNYWIYVKEHRSQFYAHTEGHTGRIKEFYSDLKQYPQVQLIDADMNIFNLIKKAKCIATVTGTVGWEGMVLGKPVIIFGLSWYEDYSGVLKVSDEKTSGKIGGFITDYRFNERNLLAYLISFMHHSVKAYYYRGLKEKMNQSESECIVNLISMITKMANNA